MLGRAGSAFLERGFLGWLVPALLASVVAVWRAWLLATDSSSVPSWDAWGGEAIPLYADWVNGTFAWSNLWAWHNEHRILFSRLLDLGLFIANEHQWDVRVQTLASSVLFASTCALGWSWLARNLPRDRAVALGIVLLALVLPPVGWANMYAGFQSCFYFALLFCLAGIAAAAGVRMSITGGMWIAALGLAGVFSLGSGLLSAIAIGSVALMRAWVERRSWRSMVAFILPLLVVVLWAMVDARSSAIRPESVAEFLQSLGIMMGWPFPHWGGAVLWLPSFAVLMHIVVTRRASKADLVFGGVTMFALLFCVAAAWSRGYNFSNVQSRYVDFLLPNLLAQLYFIGRLADAVPLQRLRVVATAVFPAIVAIAYAIPLARATDTELNTWRAYTFLSRIGALHAREFLDGEGHALDGHPHGYIPHPEAALLGGYLKARSVDELLPLSLQSVVQPARQRDRSCRWQPTDSDQLPLAGELTCGENSSGDADTAGFSVGRLSALTYRLWQAMRRPAFVAFRPDDENFAASAEPAFCALDQLNGVPVTSNKLHVAYAGVLRLGGWMAPNSGDNGGPVRVTGVLLGRDSKSFAASGWGGIPRSDVAALAHGRAGFERSGFDMIFDGMQVPAGEYALAIRSATGIECRTGVTIIVKRDSDVRLAY